MGEQNEVRTGGLLSPDGVILGRIDDEYLRHNGPEHVLCFAPTRSGKGIGLVIPTLLTGPVPLSSMTCFGRVLLFDPTNPHSSPYNSLLEVWRGDSEIRDVQNVADILVDPEGALERRNHWEKTNHSLLVGAILHVICAEHGSFLSDPKQSIEVTLQAMMPCRPAGPSELTKIPPNILLARWQATLTMRLCY